MLNAFIREADFSDLDFLYQLEAESFPVQRQSSRRSLRAALKSSRQLVLILELASEKASSQRVGAAILIRYKHVLRIYSIAVSPSRQGQGLGEILLQFIHEEGLCRGFKSLSLEADATNQKLIAWYRKHGFENGRCLASYYGKGEDGIRMHLKLTRQAGQPTHSGLILVCEHAGFFKQEMAGLEWVLAEDYLSEERFRHSERFHVINVCDSFRAHSTGYYVSLLAAARNQRILPSVMSVKDASSLAIAQSLLDEIQDYLAQRLKFFNEETLSLTIVLGKTQDNNWQDLASKLFNLFELPGFQLVLVKGITWKIRKLVILDGKRIMQEYSPLFRQAVEAYSGKKRFRKAQLKPYRYDLAILVNASEQTPPSCPKALDKFRQAAEDLGFFVEFIGREDTRRLNEFDALFIRETTAIEHHTYRMARQAWTEGLVVIDDPWSILLCSNKIYLHERLQRARIRQPRSWLLNRRHLKSALLDQMPYPLVMKLPESSFSQGVYKVNNATQMHGLLSTMLAKSDLVIAQAFLESEYDWRIGVLDQKPLFACKYYMATGHWQIYNWNESDEAGFSGKSETVAIDEVPANVLRTAVKSSALIGEGFYGVDIKVSAGKAYVIEINDNPNVDVGVEDAILGDELYRKLMQSIANRIERERGKPRYLLQS